jgi:hypothetical protein
VDKFPVVSDVLVEVTMTFGKGVNKLLVGGFRRVGEEEKEREKRAKEADLCWICCAGRCHGRMRTVHHRRAHTSIYSYTESAL